MYKNCAFTGHRRYLKELDFNLLDRVILNLIKCGTKNFYCGMAIGFDMAAAESVINYKKDYDVSLFACIPCSEQADSFGKENLRRYERILQNCDGEIILAPSYFSGCMQQRDRFLVDASDVIVSFLRKKSGGTFYTVSYAKQMNKGIIEL